jgi:hypothetical protein
VTGYRGGGGANGGGPGIHDIGNIERAESGTPIKSRGGIEAGEDINAVAGVRHRAIDRAGIAGHGDPAINVVERTGTRPFLPSCVNHPTTTDAKARLWKKSKLTHYLKFGSAATLAS